VRKINSSSSALLDFNLRSLVDFSPRETSPVLALALASTALLLDYDNNQSAKSQHVTWQVETSQQRP